MKNKGFSLVELIVVIAIMAILVGVAVPVYTSYISKAQKNKDIQMVDEIKHAVEIAAIGDKWYESLTGENKTGIGMIVIKENGTTVVPTTNASVVDLSDMIEEALEATFGASYATDIKLSYDEWKGTLTSTQGENIGTAQVISNSAYAQNIEGLLESVQNVTVLFANVIDTSDAVSLTPEMQKYMEDMGITHSNSTELAHGMVVYVSENTKVDSEAFVEAWTTGGDFSSLGLDIYGRKGAEYAYAQAMVTRIGCPKLQSEFAAYNKPDEDGRFQGAQPKSVLINHGTCSECPAIDPENPSFTVEDFEDDALAYLSVLNQVSKSKDLIVKNAADADLFKDSELVQFVRSYVSVAELMSASGAQEGDVAIVVTLNEDGGVVIDTYPLDY